MKVPQNSLGPAALNSLPVPPARRAGSGTPSAAAAASSDAAFFSASLVHLASHAMAQPEVRDGVVAHFRAQLASGAYQPNPGGIAARMLGDPITDL